MTLREIASVYGLSDNEQDIFNEYTMNRFAGADEMESPDTSFLEVWEEILLYAEMYGADKAINDNICSSRPVIFNSPDKVKIRIYGACGGRIPIIYVRYTADFEQLVTNIAYRNTPGQHLENRRFVYLREDNTVHHSFCKALQQRSCFRTRT